MKIYNKKGFLNNPDQIEPLFRMVRATAPDF